jgi:hypothetical protein
MNEAQLVGPFAMTTPPVHFGCYRVETKVGAAEMWHYDGKTWTEGDDGLGVALDVLAATGWFGMLLVETNDGLDDGL